MHRALIIICICFIMTGCGLLFLTEKGQASQTTVMRLDISGTVDYAMYTSIDRALTEAEESGVHAVLLDIDTTGGLMDAAMQIKDRLSACELPMMTFIRNRALSAGAYIALNGDKITMTDNATFGAALPVTVSESGSYTAAEQKIISAWAAEMGSLAESHGRDVQIARAMADPSIQVEDLQSDSDGVLTLTAKEAIKYKYCDYTAANISEVLLLMEEDELFQLSSDAVLTEHEPGLAEIFTRLATGSVSGTLLLAIGILGIVLEIFTVGFGIAGITGICCLGLYFGGRLLAGISGWEALLIFLLGFICLLLEMFVIPGFGVAGIAGVALLILSVFMTSVSVNQALISLTVALVVALAAIIILVKVLGKKGRLFRKLVLVSKQSNDDGYTSASTNLHDLLHKSGIALSMLRPAGAAEIEGKRVDVVTEGDYIPAGTSIRVIKVESTRVVVAAERENADSQNSTAEINSDDNIKDDTAGES